MQIRMWYRPHPVAFYVFETNYQVPRARDASRFDSIGNVLHQQAVFKRKTVIINVIVTFTLMCLLSVFFCD